jgi:DNA replication protein DnaC
VLSGWPDAPPAGCCDTQCSYLGVLVLDDFIVTPPSVIEAKDLLEVIDDRSQVRSTIVGSQLPVENWHTALAAGDPTLADAIVDRLVNNGPPPGIEGQLHASWPTRGTAIVAMT